MRVAHEIPTSLSPLFLYHLQLHPLLFALPLPSILLSSLSPHHNPSSLPQLTGIRGISLKMFRIMDAHRWVLEHLRQENSLSDAACIAQGFQRCAVLHCTFDSSVARAQTFQNGQSVYNSSWRLWCLSCPLTVIKRDDWRHKNARKQPTAPSAIPACHPRKYRGRLWMPLPRWPRTVRLVWKVCEPQLPCRKYWLNVVNIDVGRV